MYRFPPFSFVPWLCLHTYKKRKWSCSAEYTNTTTNSTSASIVDVAKISPTILISTSPQRNLLIHLLLTWPLREKEISVSLESWSYLLAYMRCDDTASTGLSPDMFSYSFCFRIWRCAWAIRIGPRMAFTWWFGLSGCHEGSFHVEGWKNNETKNRLLSAANIFIGIQLD